MRLMSLLLLLAIPLQASQQIPWLMSWEAAQQQAKSENKPILLMHVFGNLNAGVT